MEPVEPAVALSLALVSAIIGAAVFAGIAVAVRRHWGTRVLWTVWAAVSLSFAAWLTWGLMAFDGHWLVWLVMALPLGGVPSAASVVAVNRAAKSASMRLLRRWVWGFGAFLVALPVAVFLAAIPDLYRFFAG